MKLFLPILLSFFLFLQADDYELGRGVKLHDAINLGGYFSVDYQKGERIKQFRLDDVAFLAYGTLAPNLTYMAEFEAAPFYTKNYLTNTSGTDHKFHHERFYLNYEYSELFNFRAGKLITPIGYWNLEPINVLRNTSSNPLFSTEMFPKLLTGLDISGAFYDYNLQYHIFMQKNEDLDKDYINIQNKHFFGFSLEYEAFEDFYIGGSLANYIIDRTQKDVDLLEFHFKYDAYPFALQSEAVYNKVDNPLKSSKTDQLAAYSQVMYNFNMQHALIGRYEYFDDNENNRFNHIGVVGYSYRPWYSVSFKLEHQMNSDSTLSKSVASFSVLF